MPNDPEIFDVIIVGAGAAGLQAASHILQAKPSLRVLVLERSSVSGGRIRDVKLVDGVEMTGLGAWKVYSEAEMTVGLLNQHGVEKSSWSTDVKRVEANGTCVGSLSDLRSQAFPKIPEASKLAGLEPDDVPTFLQDSFFSVMQRTAQENKPSPTRLANVIKEAFDEDSEQFLSVLSHGYKAIAKYDIDIIGTLGSAKAGSKATRPLEGMSQVIKILERDSLERGAIIRHCALVNHLARVHDSVDSTLPFYEVGYLRSRGRILPGSDSEAAKDIDTDGSVVAKVTMVRSRSIILAIPPRAISRLAEQETTHTGVSLLETLSHHPTFRSCFGVPAFRAVGLYDQAWWDDKKLGLPPLGDRGMLLTNSSHLSLIMPYAGRGANGEAALHLAYCNDFNARIGGFWSKAVQDALSHDNPSSYTADHDRLPAVDKAMYRYIRFELAKAFAISPEEVPDPLRFEWHYWDDGAIHVQIQGTEWPNTTRKAVEDWAVNGPLSWRRSDGSYEKDHLVLAGEGFAEDWGWVEGALHSAVSAADTVLTWFET